MQLLTRQSRLIRTRHLLDHRLTILPFKLPSAARSASGANSAKKRKGTTATNYHDTLNLPNTEFPLSMKNICETEKYIQEHCGFSTIYSWQRNDKSRVVEFMLHDGPPYANGDAHVGHALNKIVKDITNRYKLLRGYRVHYLPGWDCHGLPIEIKALRDEHGTVKEKDPRLIRSIASEFARKAALRQMTSFKRWGVMADWSNCYFTNHRHYQAQQLQAFWQLYQKSYVFRDYMPVYWSPSSLTAVAEAELEYNDQHVSQSIYLRLKVKDLPNILADKGSCYLLVWTTTPWTIPANRAVCYSHENSYSLVRCQTTGCQYIVATDCIQSVQNITNIKFSTITTFCGSALDGATYTHPLQSSTTCPCLPSGHVTMDKGTGLVHTAPAHGHDDYQVALKYKLPVDCQVDEGGCYSVSADERLRGKFVLGDGQDKVLRLLAESVLHTEPYIHSYPYDWRTNKPVIIRASQQWFIDTSKIREMALACMETVNVRPDSLKQAMTSYLLSRSRWCISRQRVWGVPIPVFYHPGTGVPVVNECIIKHVTTVMEDAGCDAWWTLTDDQLLPKHVREQAGLDPDLSYIKGLDIFDIWLDSGISWKCVLPENSTADLYIEGVDQFRGWFQSSLLTSVALQSRAPYKNLLVHGFAVDESGRKMSKSLGNVVDPAVVIDGGKFQNQPLPGYGADVVRWWAARSYLQTNVHLGLSILNDAQKQVFNLRKSLRFILGNLSGFHDAAVLRPRDLLPQDRYMLSIVAQFADKVTSAYDVFDYPKVLILLEKFLNIEMSGFYFAVIKDRLYCDAADGYGRRSCQTVLRHLYHVITMSSAPILPHLAEEANIHYTGSNKLDSIFKMRWFDVTQYDDVNDDVMTSVFDAVLKIKDAFNSVIKSHDPVLYDVIIAATPRLLTQLTALKDEVYCPITEMLQSSHCQLSEDARGNDDIHGNDDSHSNSEIHGNDDSHSNDGKDPLIVHGKCDLLSEDGSVGEESFSLTIQLSAGVKCHRCRRHRASSTSQPCPRCMDLVARAWS